MLTRHSSKKLDVLNGIAWGIIADKVVNRREARFFKRWIKENTPTNKVWPWTELLRIAKKRQNKNTKKELLILLKKLSGLKKLSSQTNLFSSRLAFPKRQAAVIIKNKSFCLTGIFKSGRRFRIRRAIERRGGIFHKKLLKKQTDYLVVGTYASPSWNNSNLGRKLEVAKTIQNIKDAVKIISEDNLVKKLGCGR
jgi:NAD-dependent DNA ligase